MNELYDQWASDNSTWKQPWAIGGPWKNQQMPSQAPDWSQLTAAQLDAYKEMLDQMQRRAIRKEKALRLVDTDIPLDDLLDNIDEVREFLKHIKSIKQ